MEMASLLGMLGICSVTDIRKREVGVVVVCLSGILGVVYHIMYRRISVYDMLGGLLIGVFVYLIALLTREKIGKGDAIVCMVTGIYLGFWNNLLLLWLSSLLAGLAGIVAMLVFRKKKTDTLPFVPFLSAAGLVVVFGGGVLGA